MPASAADEFSVAASLVYLGDCNAACGFLMIPEHSMSPTSRDA